MPRRLEFDREAAVETAMHEIWRVGYEAASVKTLSEKLGITRSSFYNAFGDRESLFQLTLERYFDQIPERALLNMTSDTPLKPAITLVFRDVCRARAGDPDKRGCLAANAIAELLPADEGAGKTIYIAAHAMLDRLDQLIAWAKERGELPSDVDARGLALAIHSLLMGLSMQSKFVHSERDLWRSASTTLNALGLYSDAAIPPDTSSQIVDRS